MPQQIDTRETRSVDIFPVSDDVRYMEADQSEHSWVYTARLLWDRRRFIVRMTIWGAVLSIVIAFVIPKKYESTARIMPPDNQSSGLAALANLAGLSGSSGAGAAGMMQDFVGLKTSSTLFVGVLESRTVQDRLIQQFELQRVYSERRLEDARKVLQSRSDIAEDRKSGIITITVTDRDPKRATDMAQAYVEELDRLVAQVSTSAARREREFLENRLQVVKQELEQAERDFSQFSSKNVAINIQEQGKALVGAAAELEGQLIAEETQLQALKQIYSDTNIRVRSLQASIEELKRKLKEMGGTADNQESPSSDLPYPRIRQLPLLGVPYADLYRRTKIDEVVYELLTREYEMARIQEAKEIPTVKELDVPVIPQKRSFPPRVLIAFCGTLFAVCLSISGIAAANVWQHLGPNDQRRLLIEEILDSARNQFKRSWSVAVRLIGIFRKGTIKQYEGQQKGDDNSSAGSEEKRSEYHLVGGPPR